MLQTTAQDVPWWQNAPVASKSRRPSEMFLLMVDAGLCGVIFVAPYFFGGRHDLGRLVLVLLIALTAAAWFFRQALLPPGKTACSRTAPIVYAVFFLAVGWLLVQLAPLPPQWVEHCSPAIRELLPLWSNSGSDAADLGSWRSLSLVPHETTKSLVMLVSYGLLFLVVTGRVQTVDDASRLLKWVALATVIMAAFGLLQYLTSDGRFFWFYAHPHRATTQAVSGPFINRNHFAHFLVLGISPLLAWLLSFQRERSSHIGSFNPRPITRRRVVFWMLAAALALVTFTVLLSRSRGGAIVLLLAGVLLTAIYLYHRLVDCRLLYALGALAIVVVGLLSVYGYEEVAHRLDDFTEGSLDKIDHGGIRRNIWAANLAVIRTLPLTGAGAGSHRHILPAFMPQSYAKEYTHAENGYLQIATENGLIGLALLVAAVTFCVSWCVTCLRHSEQEAILWFGAAAAGLAASAAHSTIDFVWYIPACMSVTVVLAACVFRLAHLSQTKENEPRALSLPRFVCFLQTLGVIAISVWSVFVYFGPGIAAVHWDRYLRVSVAEREQKQQKMMELVASRQPAHDEVDHRRFNDLMIYHLEQVVKWDPSFARARLRLAAKYLTKFELLQQTAENSMGIAQIRDAAVSSHFDSTAALHGWLRRAVGPNIRFLHLALSEAQRAVLLCPLQGEGYLYLADLCFLNDPRAAATETLVDQALRVRPYDADVLFEAGKQKLARGDLPGAILYWQRCFGDSGPHQWKIVYLLAGRIPATQFLEIFKPDWRTLRLVWGRYRDLGQVFELEPLLAYATKAAAEEAQQANGFRPAYIWYGLAALHADMGQPTEAITYLQRAYACHPRHFTIRRALAQSLVNAGRYSEAEMHLRWCLARQPSDKAINEALVQLTKRRLAQLQAPVSKPFVGPPQKLADTGPSQR